MIRIARFAFLFLIATALVLRADPDADFAQANQEFSAGRFRQAADRYEALVRSGNFSPSLFYNLGNAWFRDGDTGRAILNYERALALDPHHPEASTNLRLVRDQARALEFTKSPVERYAAVLTLNQYCWVAAAAFWVLLFSVASGRFSLRRSAKRAALVATALVVLVLCVFVIYTLETGSSGQQLAIVTGKKIEARLATADNANSVLALPPGSEINLLSTRGDWSYAALPNQLRGWIPASSAERVRL
jgi:tetratricopeptide (TPR) repeat protein